MCSTCGAQARSAVRSAAQPPDVPGAAPGDLVAPRPRARGSAPPSSRPPPATNTVGAKRVRSRPRTQLVELVLRAALAELADHVGDAPRSHGGPRPWPTGVLGARAVEPLLRAPGAVQVAEQRSISSATDPVAACEGLADTASSSRRPASARAGPRGPRPRRGGRPAPRGSATARRPRAGGRHATAYGVAEAEASLPKRFDEVLAGPSHAVVEVDRPAGSRAAARPSRCRRACASRRRRATACGRVPGRGRGTLPIASAMSSSEWRVPQAMLNTSPDTPGVSIARRFPCTTLSM